MHAGEPVYHKHIGVCIFVFYCINNQWVEKTSGPQTLLDPMNKLKFYSSSLLEPTSGLFPCSSFVNIINKTGARIET